MNLPPGLFRQPGHGGAWTCGAGPRRGIIFSEPEPALAPVRHVEPSSLARKAQQLLLRFRRTGRPKGMAMPRNAIHLEQFPVRSNHTDRTPGSVIPRESGGSSNPRRCKVLDPLLSRG